MANRQVFVMNAGTITGQTFASPNVVTAGHVAAFDVAGGVLDVATDTPPESFYIVQGDAEYPRVSPIIKRENIRRVAFKEYEAPVAQITHVTNLPAAAEGDEFTVRVRDLSINPVFRNLDYSFTATAAMTQEQVIDRLVEEINSKTFPEEIAVGEDPVNILSGVTASKGGADTLILTADDAGIGFATALDGEAGEGTVEIDTAPEKGSGTYSQVLELELSARGTYGRYAVETPILNFSSLPFRTYAASGEEYNIYTIEVYTNNKHTGLGLLYNQSYEIVIALASDVTGDLDDFLADYL